MMPGGGGALARDLRGAAGARCAVDVNVHAQVSPVLLLNVKGGEPAAEAQQMLAEVHAALDPSLKVRLWFRRACTRARMHACTVTP